MNKTFKDLFSKYVVIYVDNVIVISKICEVHKKHLLQTLDILNKY